MCSIIAPSDVFSAKWESTHLTDPPPATRTAWNVLSVAIPVIGLARLLGWYVLAPIARIAILPAAKMIPLEDQISVKKTFARTWNGPLTDLNRSLRSHFQYSDHRISTPDGAILNASVFRHKNNDENTPTLIYFQPNMALSKELPMGFLLRQSIQKNLPCNFVQFDYRGVGDSQGNFQKTRDLIVDGESVYQFVRDHLKVPPSKIRIYGWSLGASIATNVKALHPECDGKSVLERTFSAASQVIPRSHFLLKILLCWLPWAMHSLELELGCATAASKMSGKKLIVYHPNDPVIPHPAGLFSALKDTLKPDEVLELSAMSPDWNHHCESLDRYPIARGDGTQVRADDIVADFILGK